MGRPKRYCDPSSGNPPSLPPGQPYQKTTIDSPAARFLAKLYLGNDPAFDSDHPNKPWEDYNANYERLRFLNHRYFNILHKAIINNVRIRKGSKQDSDSDLGSDFASVSSSSNSGTETPSPKTTPKIPEMVKSKIKNKSPKQDPRSRLALDPPLPKLPAMQPSSQYEPLVGRFEKVDQSDDYQCEFQVHSFGLSNSAYCGILIQLPSGMDTDPDALIGFVDSDNRSRYVIQGTMTSMDSESWVEKAFVHGEYGMFYYDEHGIKQEKMLKFAPNDAFVTGTQAHFRELYSDRNQELRKSRKRVFCVIDLPFNVNDRVKPMTNENRELLPGMFFLHRGRENVLFVHLEAEQSNHSVVNRAAFRNPFAKYGFELLDASSSGGDSMEYQDANMHGGTGYRGGANNIGSNTVHQGTNVYRHGAMGYQGGSNDNNMAGNAGHQGTHTHRGMEYRGSAHQDARGGLGYQVPSHQGTHMGRGMGYQGHQIAKARGDMGYQGVSHQATHMGTGMGYQGGKGAHIGGDMGYRGTNLGSRRNGRNGNGYYQDASTGGGGGQGGHGMGYSSTGGGGIGYQGSKSSAAGMGYVDARMGGDGLGYHDNRYADGAQDPPADFEGMVNEPARRFSVMGQEGEYPGQHGPHDKPGHRTGYEFGKTTNSFGQTSQRTPPRMNPASSHQKKQQSIHRNPASVQGNNSANHSNQYGCTMFDQAEFNDVNSQEHSFQLGNYEGQAGKNLNNRWGADMNQARGNVLPEDDGVNAVAAAEYAVEDFAAAANSNSISSEAGSTDASTAKNQSFTASFDGGGKPTAKKNQPEENIDEEHHQLNQPSDAPDAPDGAFTGGYPNHQASKLRDGFQGAGIGASPAHGFHTPPSVDDNTKNNEYGPAQRQTEPVRRTGTFGAYPSRSNRNPEGFYRV